MIIFCLLLQLCVPNIYVNSEGMTEFDIEAVEQAGAFDVSETSLSSSNLVTNMEGVFIITDKPIRRAIVNDDYIAKSNTLDYSSQALLMRIIPYSGNSVMHLPSDTHLIQAVNHTQYYLSAETSGVTFRSLGSFPIGSMLFYIYRNNDGTYTFISASDTSKALCAPMINAVGYSPCIGSYSANNNYMKWNIEPNYSWYSQISPWDGWQIEPYSFAQEGAVAVDELIFESGTYEGRSLAYAINSEGCHLNSIAMLLANMDKTTATYEYDTRLGASTQIYSDPYATAMANLNLSDWDIVSDGIIDGTHINPMFTYGLRIESTFGVEYTKDENIGSTTRGKAQYISDKLSEHPEGVVLRFSTHSIVCTNSSYTSTTSESSIDSCFTVFDPGKRLKEDGCNVSLNDIGRSVSSIKCIYYLDAA